MELRTHLSALRGVLAGLVFAALAGGAAVAVRPEATVRTGAGATLKGVLGLTTNGVAIAPEAGAPVVVAFDQLAEFTIGDWPAAPEPAPDQGRTGNGSVSPAAGGWSGIPVGPAVSGRMEEDKEGWAIAGSGSGLRGNSDGFYFVQRRVEPGGQVAAQLRSFNGTHGEAMSGLMLRDNLGESAAYAFLGLRTGGAMCLQYRQIAGGMTMRLTNFAAALPTWLRLGRQGGAVSADVSSDGREWRTIGRVNVNLGQNARAGIAVMSGTETNSVHVRLGEPVVGAAGLGYAPARGYPRMLLRGGSMLIGPVESADDSVVRLGGGLRGELVSVLNIARIEYIPLSSELEARLETGRTGLLLTDGDFLDGTLRSIRTNMVTLNSLLFGFRKYTAGSEGAALHFGAVEAEDAPYRILLRNGSELRARRLEGGSHFLRVESPMLGSLSLPLEQLKTVRRAGK